MKDFQPIPYSFDRDQEILDLLHRVFEPWPGDQAYFDWKYKHFKPEGCSFPNAWIIEDNHKIIAFNGYLPRSIQLQGESFWSVQSFDTATDPEYRGQGLFGILQNQACLNMKQHNISWVYGWTSDIGFKVFTGKMGWTVWGKQRYLMKILDTSAFVRSKVSNPIAAGILFPLLHLWKRITQPSVSRLHTISQMANLPAAAGNLLQKHNTMFSMAAQKSVAYVNWRASNPLDKLTFLTVQSSENAFLGYAAFSIRENHFDIDDIVVENDNTLKSLLAAIENHAEKNHCAMIRFRVNAGHCWEKSFRRSGYFWSKTEFALVGKKLLVDHFQTRTDNLHWTRFDRNE